MTRDEELIQLGRNSGYAMCLIDMRDLLIAEGSKGKKEINIYALCDLMDQMHEIRKATGMAETKES